MKMTRFGLAWFGSLAVFAAQAGEPPQVEIDGVPVSVGMSRSEVLRALSDYELECLGPDRATPLAECEHFAVHGRGERHRLYGFVSVRNDRVEEASRELSSDTNGSDQEFVKVLMAALERNQANQPFQAYAVAVEEEPATTDSSRRKTVLMLSEHKKIEFSLVYGDDLYVEIEESVR